MSSKNDSPIPYTCRDLPIPFRPTVVRDLGALEELVVPRGAKPCAPPARESDPRLAEAV